MAGDDEDYGSGRITIELDEGRVVQEATRLGQSIERALTRATRNIGRSIRDRIQEGLRSGVSVEIRPDLSRFDRALRTGLRDVPPATVPVTADLRQFERGLRTGAQEVRPVAVPVTADLRQLERELRESQRAVTVPVTADMSRFERELRSGMRDVVPVAVPVTADLRQFQRGLRGRLGSVNVPVTPDTGRFAASLRRSLRRVQAEIQVRADSRRLVREIERELRRIRPPNITAQVTADLSRVQSQLRSLDPPRIEATVTLDVDRIRQQLQELADQQINIPITIGGQGGAAAAGNTAGSAAMGGLSTALMAAGPWGAIIAAVAAFAALIGKTLMTGIEGVIEQQKLTGALKASLGLTEKVAGQVGRVVGQLYAHGVTESVEAGTTAVQAAIRNGLAAPDDLPGLEAITTKVADVGRLMEEDVGKVAVAVGQMVKTGLVDNASEGLDLLTKGVQGGANSAEDLLDTFTEYPVQFKQLGLSGQEALGLIQQGLKAGARDSDVIADTFKEFSIEAAQGGERVTDAFKSMGLNADDLTAAFAKGGPAARDALDEVLDKLQTIEDPLKRNQAEVGLFGTKAEDMASALKAIDLDTAAKEMDGFGGAAKRAGDDLRNNLGDKLGTIVREAKQAFQGLFTGDVSQFGDLSAAINDALPMLKETGQKVVTSILEGIEEYGPKVFKALFDLAFKIGERVDIWGPLLLKLGAAVSVLPAVLYGLLFTAIGGLLAGMGSKLLPYLQDAWDAVANFFTDTIPSWAAGIGQSLLDGLTSAFEWAKQGVSNGIDGVVEFFTAMPDRIGTAVGSLGSQIGGFFTDAFESAKQGVSSGIDTVVDFFASLPGRIGEGLESLGQTLLDLLVLAVEYATFGLVTAVLQIIWVFTELPGKIGDGLVELGAMLLNAFTTAVETVTGWLVVAFDETIAFFAALPGRIVTGLVSLGSTLRGAFVTAWSTVTSWLSTAFDQTVQFFRALPGRIVSGLSSLGSRVGQTFRSAGTSAVSAVSSMATRVVQFFSSLPGRTSSALSSLTSRVGQVFRSAGTSALNAVTSMIGRVVSTLGGLPGKARGALSGIGSALLAAGGQLVDGMIKGIRAAAGRLVSAAQDVVGGAVRGAKRALGIASPSKVFAEIGKNTGQGFIVGLTGTAEQIKKTSADISNSITKAFKGQKTKVDDRLVAAVAAGNTRLQQLAAQRDKLAAQIADAQKFATETTQAALNAFSLQSFTQNTQKITGAGILVGLRKGVEQVRAFTAQIEALKKRGLRKDLLEQIIGLGPEAGADLAATLSQQSSTALKEINSLQGQLASSATTLGKISSDALFDAGKQAGAGLLAGLKGQKKAIEKLMVDIAKGMQKSIRRALKIKSPSRVMARIGDQTGQGIEVGLVRRISALERASRSAARAVVDSVAGQFSILPGRLSSSLGGLSDASPVILPVGRGGGAGRGVEAQLLRLLAQQSAPGRVSAATGAGTAGQAVTHNWNITTQAQDSRVLAQHLYGQMARAAGV
ncbi:phage tail tape measure protein [Streptomyces sp. NPDC000341]|uniref:phage tail tape measure protein n=1 Tax=Streptomyces sp. NPDC000341 TaxID=3156645 RepID=UPI0033173506